MPRKPLKTSTKVTGIILLCLAAAGAVLLWRRPWTEPPQPPVAVDPEQAPAAPTGSGMTAEVATQPEPVVVVGPQAIDQDKELERLVEDRKARFGIETGVDFIAAPDEAIEVGGIVVPMREILDKIRLKRGDIIEGEIAGKRTRAEVEADLQAVQARIRDAERRAESRNPAERQRARAELNELLASRERLEREIATLEKGLDPDAPVALYGIHVVRPRDNIWNIHFNLLKELFRNKGTALPPLADEPTPSGRSSGVGKLLKFSENMVAIYNLRERRLDPDLNLITPNSKVVVFNFNRLFAMLDQIDYKNIDAIQFDGDTIWIPAVE
jgi:hypothetical protein